MEYTTEDIKPILEFRGYYVSRYGDIYTTKSGYLQEMKYQVVESTSGTLFKRVVLTSSHVKFIRYMHRLVYDAFTGHVNKDSIRFKDGNSLNCCFDNLTVDGFSYKLSTGEEWVVGYEGLYFTHDNSVYSVSSSGSVRKLNPTNYFNKGKYTLSKQGVQETFYL